MIVSIVLILTIPTCLAQLTQSIQFNDIGILIPDVSSYFIIGKLNVSHILSQVKTLKTLRTTLLDTLKKVPVSYTTEYTYLNHSMDLFNLKFEDIRKKIEDVKYILNIGQSPRVPRSILAASAIGLISSGANYIFNSFLIGNLQSQIGSLTNIVRKIVQFTDLGAKEIEENKKRIEELEESLSELSTHIYHKMHDLEDKIEAVKFITDSTLHFNLCFRHLDNLESNIEKILNIMSDSLHGKITLDMIPPREARRE